MRHIEFLFFIIILSALGCECPPGADTPREIIPSQYSTTTVFNAVYSIDNIRIDTKYGSFVKSLNFKSHSEINKKIGAGNNLLALFNSDNRCFYRGGLYFQKDSNYTTVLAGNEIIVASINVENNIHNLKKDSAYIKIINAAMFIDSLNISVANKYFYNQNLGNYTDFFSVPNGYNYLLVKKNDVNYLNMQFSVSKGNYYTLVLFYDPSINNGYSLNTELISQPIE